MATELAVRRTVARISRTVAIKAWIRTSRVMGCMGGCSNAAQHETADGVEFHYPAGGHDGRRATLLDQYRTIERLTHRQAIAIQDAHVPRETAEHDGARAHNGSGERAPVALRGRKAWLLREPPGGHAAAHDFHRTLASGSVAHRLGIVECRLGLGDARQIQGDGDRQLEGLADVAHVKARTITTTRGLEAGRGEFGLALTGQLAQYGAHLMHRGLCACTDPRSDQVASYIGDQQSQRREV